MKMKHVIDRVHYQGNSSYRYCYWLYFFYWSFFIGFLFVIDCVHPPGNLCFHLLVTRVPRKLAGKKCHADNCGKSMILVQIMTIIMVFWTRASWPSSSSSSWLESRCQTHTASKLMTHHDHHHDHQCHHHQSADTKLALLQSGRRSGVWAAWPRNFAHIVAQVAFSLFSIL